MIFSNMAQKLRDIFNLPNKVDNYNAVEGLQSSSPIEVTLTVIGNSSFSNVSIFNALLNAQKQNNGLPYIDIKSYVQATTSGVSYAQMLNMFNGGDKFRIGKIQVISAGAISTRPVLSVKKYDLQGSDTSNAKVMVLNTFQRIDRIYEMNTDFVLDNATEIVIGGSMNKNNTPIAFRFYPKQSFDRSFEGDFGKMYEIPQSGEIIKTNSPTINAINNNKNIY